MVEVIENSMCYLIDSDLNVMVVYLCMLKLLNFDDEVKSCLDWG